MEGEASEEEDEVDLGEDIDVHAWACYCTGTYDALSEAFGLLSHVYDIDYEMIDGKKHQRLWIEHLLGEDCLKARL